MRIACDAAARVDIDLEALAPGVAERLRASPGRRDWIGTEAFALDALGAIWEHELADSCAVALAAVHELSLVQAGSVEEAMWALADEGREAWIAGAITHELAGRLAWNVLDREGLLMQAEC